jgi:predicted glycosyltransferase
MVLKMGLQLPKFIQAIAAEHTEIENIITENKIDLVISDNRYGCWSGKIPSVSRWVRTANESAMNKYPCCWIPDYPQEHSLAGELVSFGRLKYRGQIDFIGALSRFKARKDAVRYDVVGICSGPEPQRSLLEELLLTQLKDSTLKFVIVRGVMVKSDPVRVGDSGEMTNFLTSDQLQELLPQAKYVVARSGYSTIMDMKALQSNVIFIPTPGQTEQEYLAHRLKERG